MIRAADLFCGAGGTSVGLARAAQRHGLGTPDLVAVNHWQKAVDAHELNHPWARHKCARVEGLEPRDYFPSGQIDVVVAGVECVHHSRARGGRPMNDQSRASAWHVLNWAERLRARRILIENVPEFLRWGPLGDDGRPDKARAGQTFQAFVNALDSLGYRVDWKTLVCADYGDPTTRKRLFLRANLDGGVTWPTATHSEDGSAGQRWRPAYEIIDWTDPGASIFTRKRPLADRTIARIRAGIERFSGPLAPAFLALLDGNRSKAEKLIGQVDLGSIAAAAPFMLPHDQFAARNKLSLVDTMDRPVRTITAHNGDNNYVCTPFMVPHYGERAGQDPRSRDLRAPAPTIPASKSPYSVVTPFFVMYYGTGSARAISRPSPTILAQGEHVGLASPFIVKLNHGSGVGYRVHDVRKPLKTLTAENGYALVTACGVAVDIRLRMLSIPELARAQGFPTGYQFVGTKKDQVRQIGNAVPPGTAEALIGADLEDIAA